MVFLSDIEYITQAVSFINQELVKSDDRRCKKKTTGAGKSSLFLSKTILDDYMACTNYI